MAETAAPMMKTGKRAVGRRRVIAAWVFGVLATLLAGVWVYSGWYEISFWDDKSPPASVSICISSGGFAVSRSTPPDVGQGARSLVSPVIEWYLDWSPFDAREHDFRAFKTYRVWAGFWPLILAGATTSGVLLWSARRSQKRLRIGRCDRCSYEMVKQQTGAHVGEIVCPECGPQLLKPREPRGRVWLAAGVVMLSVGAFVALMWCVSLRWELEGMPLSYRVRLANGAVFIDKTAIKEDDNEYEYYNGKWEWRVMPAEDRDLKWRASADGYPNAPKFWSSCADSDEPGARWHGMAVLWPLWVAAGGGGGWMVWSWWRWRVPRVRVKREG